METVIAKSTKSFLAVYIIIIVFGAILFLGGMVLALFSPIGFQGLYFLVFGGALLGLGIGYTVYFARLPKNCITFSEGKMRLHNGLEFSPAEIDYCTGSTLWFDWGGFYKYGTLIISVKHQEYKYKFVTEVEATAAKIKALQAQFTALEEMQKHIAEKKAAEAQVAESAENTENKD